MTSPALKDGRMIDPGCGRDEVTDLLIRDGHRHRSGGGRRHASQRPPRDRGRGHHGIGLV